MTTDQTAAPGSAHQKPASAASAACDTVDAAAHLPPAGFAATLRAERAKVAAATQACEAAIFDAALATALTLPERRALAAAVADASGVPALAAHYRNAPGLDAPAPTGARWAALLSFAQTLATEPARGDRDALLALPTAGLPVADVVLAAQLIGFVAYQARLVAGVAALQALGAGEPGASQDDAAPAAAAPFVHPANLPAPGEPLRIGGYTSETLDWAAWLPVLDPARATPEQQAVLDASHPKARTSGFYLTLALQPAVLAARSEAFNAIMYAPRGLPRAERELASTAVSRVNGCVYCAAVHAQRFEQLARRNDVIAQVFEQPEGAGTDARERAIVAASVALTRAPGRFGAAQLAPLRAAGLADLEILDLLHAAALFAWANRLMLNLGEPVFPAAAS